MSRFQASGRHVTLQSAPPQYSREEEQAYRNRVDAALDLLRHHSDAHASMKTTASQRGIKRYVFLAMAR